MTAARTDAYCIALGADGMRRFGRRYTRADAPLPQTLGVRADGRSAVDVRIDGYTAGLRTSSRALRIALGEAQPRTAGLALGACLPTGTRGVVEGAGFIARAVLPLAAQGLAIVRTGAEPAGQAQLIALSAQAGVRARYAAGKLEGTPLAGGVGALVGQVLALDSDGDCGDDLVITSDGRVPAVWPSDAQGAVAADPAQVATATTARAVTAGDVDGDGVADLVAAGDDGAVVLASALAGGGTGYRERPGAFDVQPSSARAVAFGDIDRDGHGDLLIGFSAASLRWWRGDGTGRFVLTSTALPGSLSVTAIALRDLDSDGDLDALVAADDTGAPGLHLFFNDGQGGFTDGSAAVVPADVEPSLGGLLVADVDGDCAEELLLLGRRGPPRLFGFDPTGQLDDRGVIGSAPAIAAAVGDLDGDGVPELALAGQSEVVLW